MTATPEDVLFERLVRAINSKGRLVRAWPLKGGISAEMTALEIALPEHQTVNWIVRRPSARTLQSNPQAARDQYSLLQLTHSLGLATPAPIFLDAAGEFFPTPCLVIENIDGQPVFAPPDPESYVLQFASHLAKIHSIPGSKMEGTFHPPAFHELDDILRQRPAVPDPSLEERRICDTLESAWPIPQRNPSGLLHGDYWPGNVLWKEDRLVAVIDWEDACCGDPLIDLAISRLDLLWIFGRDAMQSFTRHYQSRMSVDTTELPYWDLYAALRLIRMAGSNLAEWAAFFQPFGRPDITEQTIRHHFHFFIAQAFEKLKG